MLALCTYDADGNLVNIVKWVGLELLYFQGVWLGVLPQYPIKLSLVSLLRTECASFIQ